MSRSNTRKSGEGKHKSCRALTAVLFLDAEKLRGEAICLLELFQEHSTESRRRLIAKNNALSNTHTTHNHVNTVEEIGSVDTPSGSQ